MNKLVCITGLPGSGKSVVADYFVTKGFEFVRFGQITLDIVKAKGIEPTEAIEKKIRENIRKKHGMAAYAKLNLPKLKKIIKAKNVVVDGLYSYQEYELLLKHFGKNIILVAVFAPPSLRHNRISKRKPAKNDSALRNHPFTKKEAYARDMAELNNLNKGPAIALADYTILNTKDRKFLLKQAREILQIIQNR